MRSTSLPLDVGAALRVERERKLAGGVRRRIAEFGDDVQRPVGGVTDGGDQPLSHPGRAKGHANRELGARCHGECRVPGRERGVLFLKRDFRLGQALAQVEHADGLGIELATQLVALVQELLARESTGSKRCQRCDQRQGEQDRSSAR
jgi:hypothetical protein